MSGGSEKTEKPTPRRLSDARKRGQVAKSNDFNAALVLGGITLILMLYGTYFFQYISRLARELLWHQLRHADALSVETFQKLFEDLIFHTIIIIAPFIVGAMVVGVMANIFQIKILFTMEPLKPTLSKINPLSGFKRMFSQKSVVELLKGILKMAIVGVCGFAVVKSQSDHLLAMSQMGFAQAWMLVVQVIINISATIAIVLFVLGIADWWYQKHQLMKQLRMTRQEVKDEMKNTEGSPEVKRRIKQVGQAMVRQKMLKAVATADVIVNNPTHISVAIQYDPDVAPAPRVVAKGADHMAFQIRELAKEYGIPMVENVPLARSIYSTVEVDHMIPPELFIAVAEVLAYVFKRNKGRRKPQVRKIYESSVN
jgi:flagellar biosynthesis protein FlhB